MDGFPNIDQTDPVSAVMAIELWGRLPPILDPHRTLANPRRRGQPVTLQTVNQLA